MVSNPSTSPENNFFHPASGETSSVASGTLMDLSLIRENFQILLDSAKILDKSDNDPLLEKVADAMKSLKTPEIGKHGELLEFGSGFDEIDINHRHLSHLYGAYPGNEFTSRKNPQFFAAAKKSLERRGDYSTGWAMGWRAILWARYKESEKVCRILQHFLRIVVPAEKPNNQEAFTSTVSIPIRPFRSTVISVLPPPSPKCLSKVMKKMKTVCPSWKYSPLCRNIGKAAKSPGSTPEAA